LLESERFFCHPFSSFASPHLDFSADLFTQKFGRGNTIQTDYTRENKICFIFKHIYHIDRKLPPYPIVSGEYGPKVAYFRPQISPEFQFLSAIFEL
jgi:hypothetical protein